MQKPFVCTLTGRIRFNSVGQKLVPNIASLSRVLFSTKPLIRPLPIDHIRKTVHITTRAARSSKRATKSLSRGVDATKHQCLEIALKVGAVFGKDNEYSTPKSLKGPYRQTLYNSLTTLPS